MDLHCGDVTQLSNPTRPHEGQSRRPQIARKPHQGTRSTNPSNTTCPLTRKSSPSFVCLVDEAMLMLMGMLVPENRHWYGASRHTTYEEAKKPCPSSEANKSQNYSRDSRLGNSSTTTRNAPSPSCRASLSGQVAARLRGCALLSSRRAKSRKPLLRLSTSSTRSMPRNSLRSRQLRRSVFAISTRKSKGARRNSRVSQQRQWSRRRSCAPSGSATTRASRCSMSGGPTTKVPPPRQSR